MPFWPQKCVSLSAYTIPWIFIHIYKTQSGGGWFFVFYFPWWREKLVRGRPLLVPHSEACENPFRWLIFRLVDMPHSVTVSISAKSQNGNEDAHGKTRKTKNKTKKQIQTHCKWSTETFAYLYFLLVQAFVGVCVCVYARFSLRRKRIIETLYRIPRARLCMQCYIRNRVLSVQSHIHQLNRTQYRCRDTHKSPEKKLLIHCSFWS